jgi:aspartyl-tRNA(Asn)/glutamyl-tRNA(Gln) amidotransferase subunit B
MTQLRSILRRTHCRQVFLPNLRPSIAGVRCLWSVHSETGVISFQQEPRFQSVIGLEIHAQLDIPTKLFSSAPTSGTSLSQAPNTLVHPFDVAVPGFLPQCSQSAVHAAVLTAAALQCDIATVSRFERKHYHYADLPFGYQVTQQRWPIAKNGFLSISVSSTSSSPSVSKKKQNKGEDKQCSYIAVGINRIQLEQDTGKTSTSTIVTKDGFTATRSLVDFNRAGCALVEIVMNPDIRSSKQAAETVETLRQLLKHIGTCNGKMEEGSLRVDLNVSIHLVGDAFIPNIKNRVEVKNLNSLRQVQQAAEYEAIRQAKVISEDPFSTFQETRTFHVKTGKTILIRSKEGEDDYRFMPEPDLPPVVLNSEVSYVGGVAGLRWYVLCLTIHLARLSFLLSRP